MRRFALAVAALLLPVPALAQNAVEAAAPAAADQAYELARFLNSSERAEELWQPLFNALPTLLMEAPETAELMRNDADLAQKIAAEIWPTVTTQAEGKLPLLWDKIAAIYRQKLTPEEARALLNHFSSPANVKFTREMVQRIDIAGAMDGRSLKVDPRAAATLSAQAYSSAHAALSPAEREQVIKFKASPLSAKYATLRNDLAVARASWIEEVEPMFLKELERVVTERTLG